MIDYPTATALSAYIHDHIEIELFECSDSEDSNYNTVTSRSHLSQKKPDVFLRESKINAKLFSHREVDHLISVITGSSFNTPSPVRMGPMTSNPTCGDAVGRVLHQRWDTNAFWDNYAEVQSSANVLPSFGGFVHDIDLFDADAFRISRVEACVMDVQHRSLLEGVIEARANSSSDAHFASSTLMSPVIKKLPNTGVYVGISGTDFLVDHVKPAAKELNAFILPGNVLSVAAGRISYIFDFRGPSLAIDTACSSSIVSAHAAMRATEVGDIDAAASCGVSAIMSVLVSGLFNAAGMLASDGRCKSLDARADGYVRSEARGIVFLENFALHHENSLRGVPLIFMAGSAVNQDGRSASLTAPNGPSQQWTLRAALRNAKIESNDICRLQMHGTGTALGDPIEFGSILAVYCRISSSAVWNSRNRYHDRLTPASITVQSVKSWVGHSETAAGSVGIATILQGLFDVAAMPILHLGGINMHIVSFIASETKKNTGTMPLRPAVPRQRNCAPFQKGENEMGEYQGVSGFAFQGTNAHLVIIQKCRRSLGDKCQTLVGPCRNKRSQLLDYSRYWVLPEIRALIQSATRIEQQACVVQAVMDPRVHSHLWDHRVLRGGVFPAAGFLELATSVVATTWGNAGSVDREYNVIIAYGAIPSPLVMPDPIREGVPNAAIVDVECRADSNGEIIITTSSSIGSVKHMGARTSRACSDFHFDAENHDFSGLLMRTDRKDTAGRKARSAIFMSQERTVPQIRISTGCVINRPDDLNPYLVHPATLDNVLQLIAATRIPNEDTRTGPIILLPTGFDAYTAPGKSPSRMMALRVLAATIGLRRKYQDLLHLSNHILASPSTSSAIAIVRALAVKPVRAFQTDLKTNITAIHKIPHQRVIHAVSWEALPTCIRAAEKHANRSPSSALFYTTSMRSRSTLSSLSPLSRATLGAARVTSFVAQAAQQLVSLPQDWTSLPLLCTRDAHPQAECYTPYGSNRGFLSPGMDSAVWGTWSVAAAESSSSIADIISTKERNISAWTGLDLPHNAYVMGDREIRSQHISDAFGIIVRAGALTIPRMIAEDLVTEDHSSIQEGDTLNYVTTSRRVNVSFPQPPPAFEPGRPVHITGGTGGVPLLVASWISPARRCPVVLGSRAGRTLSHVFGRLLTISASPVVLICADVATSEAAFCIGSSIGRVPVAVMHAAGVLRDAFLVRQTVGNVNATHAPKCAGWTKSVSKIVSKTPLNAAIAFGSLASIFGSVGQSPYAAANAALVSRSAAERSAGITSRAIVWGAWRDAGMAASGGAATAERFGLGSIDPSVGIIILSLILAATKDRIGALGRNSTVIASPFDWLKIEATLKVRSQRSTGMKTPSLVHDLIHEARASLHRQDAPLRAATHRKNSLGNVRDTLPHAYRHVRGDTAVSAVTERLVTLISESTGETVYADDPLMESGLDSVAGVELQQRAEQEFNVRLESTAALDYPTATALGHHITRLMGLLDPENEPHEKENTVLQPSSEIQRAFKDSSNGLGYGVNISISGAIAIFAGEVDDSSMFWNKFALSHVDPQTTVPLSRYDIDQRYDPTFVRVLGAVSVRQGAFLPPSRAECFDAEIMHMSSTEAYHLDPQHRLLLESVLRCLQAPEIFSVIQRDRTGVFVGCMYNEMPQLQQIYDIDAGTHAGTGSGAAFMCGRVSYVNALSGPCIATDTACSSSLVAAHLARRATGIGEAAAGVVAGVNLALSYVNTSVICAIGALSSIGRCKTLDASADGYGRGEGCGTLFVGGYLLSQGLAIDGQNGSYDLAGTIIFASPASAVNQDGRSSALTAPHGPSQQALLADILKEAQYDETSYLIAGFDFIAMHGTGTGLGDPIETGALAKCLASFRYDNGDLTYVKARLALCAPKSHYGHSEGAAGVAGILASIGHLARLESAPIKHLRFMNPFVASALDGASLTAPGASRERIATPVLSDAGTSSFGMSGVNAHMLLRPVKLNENISARRINTDSLRVKCYYRRASRFGYFPCPHPLLFACNIGKTYGVAYHCCLNDVRLEFMRDHCVMGHVLFPAAGAISAIAATAHKAMPNGDPESAIMLDSTTLLVPLILKDYGRKEHHIEIHRQGDAVRMKKPHSSLSYIASRLAILSELTSQRSSDIFDNPEHETNKYISFSRFMKKQQVNCVAEGLQKNVNATIHSPVREPDWIDIEAIDASLHLVAAVATDVRDLKLKNTLPARIPASISACMIRSVADISSCERARPNAAAKLRGPDHHQASIDGATFQNSDNNMISDHFLSVDRGGSLNLMTGMLTRPVTVTEAADANMVREEYAGARYSGIMLDDKSEQTTLASLLSEVAWETFPGKADGYVQRKPVTAVRSHGTIHSIQNMSKSHHQRPQSYVACDIARAMAISSVASAIRSRVGMVDFSTFGGMLTAAGINSAVYDDPSVSASSAALHAIARSIPQELPGLDVRALDFDVAAPESFRRCVDSAIDSLADFKSFSHDRNQHNSKHSDYRYGAATRGNVSSFPTLAKMRESQLSDMMAGKPVGKPQSAVSVRILAAELTKGDIIAFRMGGEAPGNVPMRNTKNTLKAKSAFATTAKNERCFRIVVGIVEALGRDSEVHTDKSLANTNPSVRTGDGILCILSMREPLARIISVDVSVNVIAVPARAILIDPVRAAAMARCSIERSFSHGKVARLDDPGIGSMMAQVATIIVYGELTHQLDVMSHPASNMRRALRCATHSFDARSQHTRTLNGGTSCNRLSQQSSTTFLHTCPKFNLSESLGGRPGDLRSVLITGGTGALGAQTGAWFTCRGSVGRVALIGRSGRSPDVLRTTRGITNSARTSVMIIASDISRAEDVDVFGSQTHNDQNRNPNPKNPPGLSIVHAGGVLADAPLAAQTAGGVRHVSAPKHHAAARMMFHSSSLDLTPSGTIIAFSSIAAMLGAAGQMNYAASNAALDSAIAAQRNRGFASVSAQWGAWSGGGMADRTILDRALRMGIGSLSPEIGLEALAYILAVMSADAGAPHTTSLARLPAMAISPFEWNVFLATLPGNTPRFFESVMKYDQHKSKVSDVTKMPSHHRPGILLTDAAHKIASIPESSLRISAVIRDVVTIAGDVASVEISPTEPLMDSGIDSLAGIELKNKVEAMYGLELPTTAAFDYPSVETLARYIESRITDETEHHGDNENVDRALSPENDKDIRAIPAANQSVDMSDMRLKYSSIVSREPFGTQSSSTSRATSAVAILGWAGAAGGDGLLLQPTFDLACIDAITPVSWDRYDHDDAGARDPAASVTVSAAAAGKFGGWVPEVARFDVVAFGMTMTEASLADPQQRHLLEATHALVCSPNGAPLFDAAAGLPGRAGTRVSSTGVVAVAVGISVIDYVRITPQVFGEPPNPYLGTGNAVSVACGRLSFAFGFQGASAAIDTACSSSLVAAHIARGAIIGGNTGGAFGGVITAGAIVAGAALILAPHATGIFAAAGMLAADGRCKTLDALADGYVRTEAVLVLPLWSTGTSSSGIYATPACKTAIRSAPALFGASAVNQDGRSSALTAPNGPSQQETLTSAAKGVVPALEGPVNALEMHGTGTALGDPIEVGAVVSVISNVRDGFAKLQKSGKDDDNINIMLALSAIKSSRGHAEAAAGVWGLIHAASQLVRQIIGPTLHLRSMSSYVTRAFEAVAGSPSRNDKYHEGEPRQLIAAPARNARSQPFGLRETRTSVGISSFAFQGTNAHCIILLEGIRTRGPSSIDAKTMTRLSRMRFWCMLLSPHALGRALVDGRRNIATFYINLKANAPNLTQIAHEHSISGRRVVPVGILLSAVTASARVAFKPDDLIYCASISAPTPGANVDVIFATVDAKHGEVDALNERGQTFLLSCEITCGVRQIPSQTSMQTQTPKFLPKRPYHLSNPFRIFSRKFRCKSCETPSLVIVRRHAHSFRSMGCTVSVAPFTAVSPHMGNYASLTFVSAELAMVCDISDGILENGAPSKLYDVVATRHVFETPSQNGFVQLSSTCAAWAIIGTRAKIVTHISSSSTIEPKSKSDVSTWNGISSYRRRHPLSLELNKQAFFAVIHWILSMIGGTPQHDESKMGNASGTSQEANTPLVSDEASIQSRDKSALLLGTILEVLNDFPRPDGCPYIDANTDLLSAGFDSLQFIDLRRHIEGILPSGVVVSVEDIISNPTPAALVAEVVMRRMHASTIMEATSLAFENQKNRFGEQNDRPVPGTCRKDRDFPRATAFLTGMTISILSVMCATLVVALLMQRAKAGPMTIQVLEKDVDISAHANADVGAILQSSQHFEKDES